MPIERSGLHHPLVMPAQWYRAAQLLSELSAEEQKELIYQAQSTAWAAGWHRTPPRDERVSILGHVDAADDLTEALVVSTLETIAERSREGPKAPGYWVRDIS